MSKSLFLAGATGAVGRRLLPLLVADGWRVAAATRVPEKAELLRRLWAEPVVVDLAPHRLVDLDRFQAIRRLRREAGGRFAAGYASGKPALRSPSTKRSRLATLTGMSMNESKKACNLERSPIAD